MCREHSRLTIQQRQLPYTIVKAPKEGQYCWSTPCLLYNFVHNSPSHLQLGVVRNKEFSPGCLYLWYNGITVCMTCHVYNMPSSGSEKNVCVGYLSLCILYKCVLHIGACVLCMCVYIIYCMYICLFINVLLSIYMVMYITCLSLRV